MVFITLLNYALVGSVMINPSEENVLAQKHRYKPDCAHKRCHRPIMRSLFAMLLHACVT